MGTLRALDLFCGTGGFSKGFEDEGHFQVAFGLDLLPVAIRTFRLNHPAALAGAGDIRAVRPADVAARLGARPGDVDVIIGGPPCQGFSSIRPHRSAAHDDRRNALFKDFAVYVDYFRPHMFVMENVVGLVTHDRGRTLAAIEEIFAGLGYDTDWRIVNAAHFGIPQKRERLIMLGAERGTPLSFPTPTHAFRGDTIGLQDRRRMLLPAPRTLFNQRAPLLPPAITVAEAIDDLPAIGSGERADAYTTPARTPYQEARRAGSLALTWHASTAHTPKMLEIIRHAGPNISCIPEHLITSGFSSCYSRLAADEPSVTITVNFVHPASNRCIHPWLDRALTPREGARLQGFDDTFQFAGSRTEVVKQIGNAVPPLLGRAIAAQIAQILGVSGAAPDPAAWAHTDG
ncbi:MAG TPA: DNA cytosine methyltransferase [Thermomicrobiales bacterium]|nr:DNA cytosine methyltransferase [Thermomicrobiales bacterium]